jgi:hypothetical protein
VAGAASRVGTALVNSIGDILSNDTSRYTSGKRLRNLATPTLGSGTLRRRSTSACVPRRYQHRPHRSSRSAGGAASSASTFAKDVHESLRPIARREITKSTASRGNLKFPSLSPRVIPKTSDAFWQLSARTKTCCERIGKRIHGFRVPDLHNLEKRKRAYHTFCRFSTFFGQCKDRIHSISLAPLAHSHMLRLPASSATLSKKNWGALSRGGGVALLAVIFSYPMYTPNTKYMY